jgi:hypothetical protein
MSDDPAVRALQDVIDNVRRDAASKAVKPRINKTNVFAIICVAVTTVFVIGMSIWSSNILASASWCRAVIDAHKAAPGTNLDAGNACVAVLLVQLRALAINSHIYAGVIALCLGALVVIVVAGGRLSASGSMRGGSVSISPASDPVTQAANQVADAAASEADDIARNPPAPSPKGLS